MNITGSNESDYIPTLIKTTFVNSHEYCEIDGNRLIIEEISWYDYFTTI